jgi:transcription antitermination factor NusG
LFFAAPAVDSDCPHAAALPWYAVRVKPNFEQTTARWLDSKGYEHLAPTYRERRTWSDRVKETEFPLFPGYIFCRFRALERLPVLQSPGVLGIVGFGRELAAVDDREIASIRGLMTSRLGIRPWPYLQAGRKILVSGGPLKGIEGLVVEAKDHYRLVVSIDLLQRSVAVEIERRWVQPLN